MDKSYVTMEQRICIVCGKTYDTGSILMDKRLKDTFDMHTVTGMGMCEEHTRLKNEGYVAIIGCDESKSNLSGNRVKPENAYRTGSIAHLKREVFNRIFNQEAPKGMVVFCEQEVIEHLGRMQKGNDNGQDKDRDSENRQDISTD